MLERQQVINRRVAQAIVDRLASGEGYRRIAASLGLNENLVRNIKRKKSWPHVKPKDARP